jgi:hypothetical protein
MGRLAVLAALGALVAGCAAGGSGSAFTSGPAGGSCDALRKEMNGLVARGVTGEIEAQEAGRKLSKEAAARVARYNAVLEGYLGQECQNQ